MLCGHCYYEGRTKPPHNKKNQHNKGAIQASYPLSSIIDEGFLSGNGLSRRNYVWRGFCPRGFCPEMAYV